MPQIDLPEDELRSVWASKLRRHGVEHTDRDVAFLRQGIRTLASERAAGPPTEGFTGLRRMTVYEVDHDAGIVSVLHVFHTKQDLGGRLRKRRS